MTFDLYRCTRCELVFAADVLPRQCPACRIWHSAPTQIVLAGRNVEVPFLRIYGPTVLKSQDVREQFARMDLGDRCEHGYMSAMLCQKCNA